MLRGLDTRRGERRLLNRALLGALFHACSINPGVQPLSFFLSTRTLFFSPEPSYFGICSTIYSEV